MNDPFYPWLKRLEGKTASMQTTVGTDTNKYDGVVVLADKNLVLLRDRDKSHVFSINDIDHIEFDKEYFRLRASSGKGDSPFWKWLKGLEKKDAKIYTPNSVSTGTIVKVDKTLVFVEDYNSVCILKIKDVRSIVGKNEIFNIKAIVKFEEVE